MHNGLQIGTNIGLRGLKRANRWIGNAKRNENGFAIQMWYDRVRIEVITKHKHAICVLRYRQI